MPRFSVIIPIYNKEKDVETTIKSVLNQTYVDYEVILVDDGSTDNSLNIVNAIEDDRIQIFTKQNEGVSKTRNYGITKSKAEYIAFLDADDYWYPNHLETLHRLIKKFPEETWYATAYEKRFYTNFKSPMNSPILTKGKDWSGKIDNYFKYCLVDSLAWTSAVCMKKDFLSALDGFDFMITHGAGEDTDLWIRAALKSPLIFSNNITATHNLDGTNRISNTPTLKRTYMDLDNYEDDSKNNSYLKKYLDLNRYSFAIQHKISNDYDSFNNYVEKLNIRNLNSKQRLLLSLPTICLRLLLNLKNKMEQVGYRLSSF